MFEGVELMFFRSIISKIFKQSDFYKFIVCKDNRSKRREWRRIK
jgi:hypothetical protein